VSESDLPLPGRSLERKAFDPCARQLPLGHAEIGDPVIRVKEPNHREVLGFPVVAEDLRLVGPHDQDLGLACAELWIIVAQLRYVRAAEGSTQAVVEHQHDVLPATLVREGNSPSPHICEGEIRAFETRAHIGPNPLSVSFDTN
jgi:hypothetical protein